MLPYVDKIEFELLPRPTKGEDGKPLLYVRPVTPYKFDIDYIDKFCAEYRNTKRGEIVSAFNTFLSAASQMLASGFRLETPIGTFAPKLKLNGDFTDPKQVKKTDVSYVGVEFVPSKQFQKEADCSQRGKSFKVHSTMVGNAQMHDQQAMNNALQLSMFEGHVTIKTFMMKSGLKYNSAKRYLDSLCEGDDAHWKRVKEGGVTFYYPIEPSSEKP